jgi:hypothetical protein
MTTDRLSLVFFRGGFSLFSLSTQDFTVGNVKAFCHILSDRRQRRLLAIAAFLDPLRHFGVDLLVQLRGLTTSPFGVCELLELPIYGRHVVAPSHNVACDKVFSRRCEEDLEPHVVDFAEHVMDFADYGLNPGFRDLVSGILQIKVQDGSLDGLCLRLDNHSKPILGPGGQVLLLAIQPVRFRDVKHGSVHLRLDTLRNLILDQFDVIAELGLEVSLDVSPNLIQEFSLVLAG